MTGFEALPVLDQIFLGIMVTGGIVFGLAAIALIATYTVLAIVFAFDLFLDWTERGLPSLTLPPRFLFRHEPEIVLPYERQIQALEGTVVS